MTYVKIKETLYPAEINGALTDYSWDNRDSKTIKLEMTHAEAAALFVDGLAWSIVCDTTKEVVKEMEQVQEDGTVVIVPVTVQEPAQEEFDNSDYCVAGDITDHRDGTLSVKMGKFTTEELLLMEVLA